MQLFGAAIHVQPSALVTAGVRELAGARVGELVGLFGAGVGELDGLGDCW